MPRENINADEAPDFRTEVGWKKDEQYVQVATTNRNHQPEITLEDGPFDGWHATYNTRESVNRLIWALRKARDEAFGPDAADELTVKSALGCAAAGLVEASRAASNSRAETGNTYVRISSAWVDLARHLGPIQ